MEQYARIKRLFGEDPLSPIIHELVAAYERVAAVVEHCEDRAGLRRTLAGLDRAPKTGAARLANIRRVLEMLREHRTMPLTHLWSETALRDGDPAVVRSLLLQVRKAYGQHLPAGGSAPSGRASQLGHSGRR